MKTKLRKVVMLALVLVLLISNTVGANASTGDPTTVVDSYGALFSAIAEAKSGDVIGVKGVITIPAIVKLDAGSRHIVIKRMEADAKIVVTEDYGEENKATFEGICFDGNSGGEKPVGGTEPIDPPVEPSEPTDPDEGDNTGGNDGTTTPEDPDQGNTEEPTPPDGGEKPTDPPITPSDEGGDNTGADTVEPDTPSDAGKGDTIDNSSTDNSDNSTTDNSQTSTSIDNSTSSSTVDNSSVVSNTDNSTHKEENSKTENSNNSTTYNYYTSPEATGGSQNVLPPISVNVTIPQGKEPEIGSQELSEAKQNIYIDAEGVNVKYEYTADGVSISISPYIAPESSPEGEVISTAYSPVETPQEPSKSSISWVDYVSMILLALLVFAELRDHWFRLKNKAE